jgi:hypothetical protein
LRRRGLKKKVSTSKLGGRGFKPRLGHAKDFKNNGRLFNPVRHSTFKGEKVDWNAPFQYKVAGGSLDRGLSNMYKDYSR